MVISGQTHFGSTSPHCLHAVSPSAIEETNISIVNHIYNIDVINPPMRQSRLVLRPKGVTHFNLIPITLQPSPPTAVASSTLFESESSPAPALTPHKFKNRKGLGLIHLNIRSILAKERMDHLKILISQTNPDILVLSETWLKKGRSNSEIFLFGFNVFRIDRNARAGGVAIFIKSRFSVTILQTVSKLNYFEFISLLVNLGPNNSVVVIGVYRPPSADPRAIDKLAELISQYSNMETLLVGDLNCNWQSNASDYLKEVCGDLNLVQLIKEPTRPNLNDISRSTLIDLIFTNRVDKIIASGVFELGMSDHCPIACIRDTHIAAFHSEVVIRRNFKHFNEMAFLSDLQNSSISNTMEIMDVNLALDHFIHVFNSIVNIHAPFKKQRIQARTNPWFNSELTGMLQLKNKAWVLARKSGNPSHWVAFRQLRNTFTAAVRKAKSDFYLEAISECHSNPAKFWKIVNSVNDKRKATSLPALVKIGQSMFSDQNDICNAFNKHFADAGNLFENLFENENMPQGSSGSMHEDAARHVSHVERHDSQFSLEPFIYDDIFNALLGIDPKKATGEDCLDPFVLKLAAPFISEHIMHIFNLSVTTCTVPNLWKMAQISPLHKGGAESDPNNYRPISKLSCLAKILESLVNNQIKHYLSNNSILTPLQSGFRAKHSTITATTLIINNIASAMDKSKHCAAIFIDLSKAFDTVDHSLLLFILHSVGFDSDACSWFQSYLSERSQCVKAGKAQSGFLPISKGVPQGSILGPALFTLYINNMALSLDGCQAHFYADDTILYCIADTVQLAVEKLQLAFNAFQESLKKLKLVLNAGKTKFILFSRAKDIESLQITTTNGSNIERISEYKSWDMAR